MELPREPTEIPQARRYTRCFHGEQGKKFQEQQTITINIPRIQNTYMTKDVKLHFDFDMTYQEASRTKLNEIFLTIAPNGTLDTDNQYKAAMDFFGMSQTGVDLGPRPINVYTKPIPTFDVNGPYGLISRIQVFDFLGNTLLEDVQEHDLLTAQFADFWFKDDNMEIERPRITDFFESTTQDMVTRKEPCARYFGSDSTAPNQKLSTTSIDFLNGSQVSNTKPGVTPGVVNTSNKYSLDLFSFLGRFSDKFTPLHNGFKVVFTLNKFSIPIQFNTPLGDCIVGYKNSGGVNQGTKLDPTILSANVSNVYIKSDLLEISPELDSKVDKLIFSQGWKYQKDFFTYPFDYNDTYNGPRVPYSRRIIPDLKSVNKIFVGQRPQKGFVGREHLGFRIRNYTDQARLLFNKSEVCKISNVGEAYTSIEQATEQRFDDYLDISDFNTNIPMAYGTDGQQFTIVSYGKQKTIQSYLLNNAMTALWWPGMPSPPLTTQFQGRYLIAFDTRIPGATASSVAGIDTSKNVLEYELSSDSEICLKSDIDVFIQHDSFIMVEPGKSTTVNF